MTPAQQRVLAAIADWHQRHGYPPSVRDLAMACGHASTSTTHAHLRSLRASGAIRWTPGCARTIVLGAAA
jgi:repressor LexA